MNHHKIKLLFTISGMLFGVFLCSHSAYATSYISVSSGSGGTVSFGSIKPTSTGTSATASDTLTVHTDCSSGYSVYVSGQSGKDTNLTNKSAESDNIISTSSATIGETAATLNVNTWGLNYEDNGTYVGLPEYSETLPPALITIPSASETSTVDIYYGLKVNTAITPGTYTGDVLYTVLSNSACSVYTVRLTANGGTGTMNGQTINVGETTNLSMNTFTRSGYMFLGWATGSSATTPTYKDGESVTDIADFNSTIDLYAVWGKSTGNMQDFQCTNLAAGTTIYLTDTRDNQVYSVYRWPTAGTTGTDYPTGMAGACLMTKDLSLGYVTGGSVTKGADLILTTADSNFDANASNASYESFTLSDTQTVMYVDPANNGSGWAGTNSYTNQQYTDGPKSGLEVYSSHAYYSWGAAIVVCPKSWRLLTNTEYYNVTTFVGGSDPAGSEKIRSQPYNFVPGGSFGVDGFGSSTGADGHYWSSTQGSRGQGYGLGFNSSILATTNFTKNRGRSVRCLAQNNYTVNYASTGVTSGSPSKTTEGTVYESDSVAMPTVGTMKKTGYEFKGWALTSGATSATYTASQTVTLSTLLTAASSAGQTVSPGSTITLYPVWTVDTTTMQGWVASNGCSALSTNQYITLKDARDGEKYVVKKLADGKCWMVQNLRLVGPLTLTPNDSNISSNFTLPASTSNWCTSSSSSCVDQTRVYYDPSETSDSSKASYYGALYKWYAATAGTGKYNTTSTNATASICPKGWRLPTGGAEGDFVALDKALGGSGTNRENANTYGAFIGVYTSGNNSGFMLGGVIANNIDYVNSQGRYWSSTASSANSDASGFLLSTWGGGDVNPLTSFYKHNGNSVRCIAAP